MRSERLVFAFVFVVTLLVTSGASQSSWSPEAQVKLKALGSPRVSPDGTRVVYTVNEAVMTADRSEFITQIWMSTIDGREHFQLTYGDKSSTNPKWSPDGSSIAFTSNRKDNRSQLFVLRMAGGEAEQITDGKGAVGDFEWSHDGRSIAFLVTDPKSDDEEKNDRGRNDFRFVDENTKYARLYVTPLAKDAEGKRIARKLTNDDRHVNGFDWSPDGSKIIYSHVRTALADHWPTADVAIVNVASGSSTPFATTAAAETSPSFSPDGRWVALVASELPVRWAQSNRIQIFAAAGGTPRVMPLSHDGQPNIIGWTPDSAKIMFTEAKGTGTALYEVNVAAGTIREVDFQNAVIAGVNMTPSGSRFHLAFVQQTSSAPPEVYGGAPDGTSIRQVTRHNAEHLKLQVGRTDVIKWKSKDGREIEGLLTYPVGYTAGTRVPLILNIHGGPAGVFQQTYPGGRGSYPLATFSAKGIAVLRPNPRGSSGYGTEFRRANIKDWGFGDYEDLMTGVDHVISMGVADPDRLGVMGWSYGGYMTSMIITKTNRFKAASAGAPVTNMMSFNGTADIPSFLPDYFEAEFWDNPQIYSKHSAMFNIKNAKTPTLVQHGENDLRVPIAQGYELYTALKRQGVPTRMIVLPRQPHGIQEPKLQIAVMQSNIDWFEKYLK